ncbi:bifunctional phosphoribosyl-AMP cyclohydrolase/phosphoribosyl-ATP diphosphatase HisIE [Longimicrobium sp.]|uniref:bifunctional phosphoribosyl-AMP cyclohydrolase/phosphoribosyl-ATP diphosphatase HisIE n=1 Tax=Longimicrobium sp. TaxID=2029185 RepID=UPI002BBC4D14|nr:bifunctional phosphoribosyl-AMP cyclohydrolase/phosphoribosyl-ATP diphosphatase HisIE [Longimicrobium sp.]HSU16269.1 bifunctional phosphoribosyl-AMP cyclohydrolase/phosphoribosyl-ATP diphosphatase HisIE [Longimicrobium sp.]
MSWLDSIRFDDRGLVPVVAQDARTGEVLMLAWANAEALRLTRETGRAHYWSRSRGELWKKGETSGNAQEVDEVRVDCDADAVLYRVRQTGPACHTGERSCFFRAVDGEELRQGDDSRPVLARVEEIVAARDVERPEGSYTTYLFAQGIDKILKKVGEEATETIIAAKNDGTEQLRSESADLLYHLLVLWRAKGLPLDDLWSEFDRRFGQQPREGSADPASRRSSEVG